jgi:hypothetical protein
VADDARAQAHRHQAQRSLLEALSARLTACGMRVGPRDHRVGKGQGLPGVARRLPLAPKEDGEKAHHTRICVHDLFGPAAGFKVVNPRVEHVGRYPAQRSTDRTAVERDQAASIRLPFFLERRVAAHVEELAEELVGSCSDTWRPVMVLVVEPA